MRRTIGLQEKVILNPDLGISDLGKRTNDLGKGIRDLGNRINQLGKGNYQLAKETDWLGNRTNELKNRITHLTNRTTIGPSRRFQAYLQLAQFLRYIKSCKQAFKPVPPD